MIWFDLLLIIITMITATYCITGGMGVLGIFVLSNVLSISSGVAISLSALGTGP